MDEYREIVSVKPVLLLRSDLPKLEDRMREDLTPKPDSIDVRIVDEHRMIRAKSVAELFEMELPETTSRLYINLTSWTADDNIDASVSVSLSHNNASYYLHSLNEALFLGKKAQLDRFFRQHRPWYSPITRALPFAGSSLLMVGLATGVYFKKRGHPIAATLALALAVLAGVTTWLGFEGRLFPYVRVRLTERAPQRSAWEFATLILGVGLLLATIVNSVVQVVAIINRL